MRTHRDALGSCGRGRFTTDRAGEDGRATGGLELPREDKSRACASHMGALDILARVELRRKDVTVDEFSKQM